MMSRTAPSSAGANDHATWPIAVDSPTTSANEPASNSWPMITDGSETTLPTKSPNSTLPA
jgi:hypothetical protein